MIIQIAMGIFLGVIFLACFAAVIYIVSYIITNKQYEFLDQEYEEDDYVEKRGKNVDISEWFSKDKINKIRDKRNDKDTYTRKRRYDY